MARRFRVSGGILLFRRRGAQIEVFLAHPGGPFWARRDAGAWTIPKGELEPYEDPLSAAQREFGEEIGFVPEGEYMALGSVKQRGGKTVHGWAVEGDADPGKLRCVTVDIEWPPRTGKYIRIPEIDRAEWFEVTAARAKINPAQAAFLDRLIATLATA